MVEIRYTGDALWERIGRAVEKVKDRLRRVTQALNTAGIPYAVIGGNATGQTARIRIDNFVSRGTDANPTYQLVDAKFSSVNNLASPNANLANTVTANQAQAYPWISSGQNVTVVPRAQNAINAGLTSGVPIKVNPGVQIHVNVPNGIVVRAY